MLVRLCGTASVGLACILASSASAQLHARKDLSANIAVTIAQTAMATCTANGYRVSATVVGRNARCWRRSAATAPARIQWRTVSRRPLPRARSASRQVRWKIG